MLTSALYYLFLLAVTYQCLVYVYLALTLRRYATTPPDASSESNGEEGVSIIVCAHNERSNLATLLPLLEEQRYGSYEIVIADDRSTDGTYDYLLEEAQTSSRLRVVRIDECPPGIQSKKYALTRAIEAAHYDRLLLTDADCVPHSSDWLRLMAHPLRRSIQFVLGYSPYHYRASDWLNRFIRYETLHTGFLYTAAAAMGRPYMGVGRNLAYRKLFFKKQGGFNDYRAVVGGDDDLWVNHHATKNNVAIVLTKEALTYSIPKTSWSEYYYQKKRHLHVGKHYRLADRIWLGLLSLSSILVWVLVIPLVFLCNEWEGIVALFLLRWFILAAALSTAGRQLHDPIKLRLLPILDFLHVMYYIVVGTLAFSAKDIRWTT